MQNQLNPINMNELNDLLNNKQYHGFSDWAVTRFNLTPTKNSGDGGFDGIGHYSEWIPEGLELNKGPVMAEVKSGKITIAQVRSFCQSMNSNAAIAGVFITLEKVSTGMKEQARLMGSFKVNGIEYPRLQFWQITQEYFDNPDSINEIIRLPKPIKSTKKTDLPVVNNQANLLELME